MVTIKPTAKYVMVAAASAVGTLAILALCVFIWVNHKIKQAGSVEKSVQQIKSSGYIENINMGVAPLVVMALPAEERKPAEMVFQRLSEKSSQMNADDLSDLRRAFTRYRLGQESQDDQLKVAAARNYVNECKQITDRTR